MDLTFEWDEEKALNNLRKHGIAFDEARTVFNDALTATIHDVETVLDKNPQRTTKCARIRFWGRRSRQALQGLSPGAHGQDPQVERVNNCAAFQAPGRTGDAGTGRAEVLSRFQGREQSIAFLDRDCAGETGRIDGQEVIRAGEEHSRLYWPGISPAA